MRYDSAQFGSFDARDNRREVFILFERLGENLPDEVARAKRAGFLQALIPHGHQALADRPLIVNPDQCSAVGAYQLFVAITGVLGVPVEKAAKILEEVVRKQDSDRRHTFCHS